MLEYKFFEPAFYHTDVPGLGYGVRAVAALGDRAVVCLDTGHHAPGTNIEFIVALLLRLGKLGSFDFNCRFYADDDLIVGAADPFQLFRIMFECVRGGGFGPDSDVAFMLDQCHNIEPKIPGQIRSVLNVQEMTAKALLVDRDALTAAQESGDVLAANAVLMDAYYTDVRPTSQRGARSAACRPNPMRPTPTSGLPGADRGGPRRRHAGRMELTPDEHDPTRPSPSWSPARTGWAPTRKNTNYAGGNTSAKGTDDRPGDRRAGRAAVGEGLRR